MSSSSANGDEAIASESKFKGEAYEIRDNRTVFVGSMEGLCFFFILKNYTKVTRINKVESI